jgi:PAS domain S-box-containing protein
MAIFAQKPITEVTLKALASVSDSMALGIDHKRAKENLLTVKNRLEFLFTVSPVMIYSAKYDDYRFTFMSKNVSLQLGHYAEEFIDNPRFWIDHVHPEDLPHILDKLSHLAEVNTVALEYRFLHKDGTYRSMYDELDLVRDTVGNPVEIIGYWVDVTEKNRMEEEQNTLREHLYHLQKLESVGTLAGGIAHDFNNILAIIIGYGNLLEKSLGKDNPSRFYIQKILKSAERATNLVQGLLAFSRKQGSCQKPVSISSILLPVNNLLSRLIGENIVLDIVPANKDCVVMADCGQMEQVLINLATNARDAMPNGGKLTIQADIVELGSEFIRTHGYGEIGEYARISVSDTGMGMDKETQRRIFQPFFTTKEVGKGTGLGLSIVYGIIKQHGGYINVESEPGKGATFRIYLPLIKSTVEEEKPTPLPAYLTGTEMILVAEDEEEVRNLAKSLLEEAGYTVIAAVDGYDTINKFMENNEDVSLLLLDVVMPTKTGREAYKEISKIRPDIKALFMSGYSESSIHKITVLKEGFHFISKPFSQTALLKKVREILDNE